MQPRNSSIYSVYVLQCILDRWHVGKIEEVSYFANVGFNIWRHFITTNQGDFELYSYPLHNRQYAKGKLSRYLDGRKLKPLAQCDSRNVFSFERYHVLVQLTKKFPISFKQAKKDIDLLTGLKVARIFRAYGTIIQAHLGSEDIDQAKAVIASYGHWSIQDIRSVETKVLAMTEMNSYEVLDKAVDLLDKDRPLVKGYNLDEDFFELHFSNGMLLSFSSTTEFAAARISFLDKRNELVIFNKEKIFYERSV